MDASIIRLALGLAVQRAMHMAILDVPTAFLGSKLHETIYMGLSECDWRDMDPASRSRPLVKLRATLYGLKQAGRYWFEDVYDFVVDSNGFPDFSLGTAFFYFFTLMISCSWQAALID